MTPLSAELGAILVNLAISRFTFSSIFSVQLQFFKLLIPALCFARSLFPVAEFILYHFHLLAQNIFLLILFDCLLHALFADVALHGKNLIFL